MIKTEFTLDDEGRAIGKGFEAEYYLLGNGVMELKFTKWPDKKSLPKSAVRFAKKLTKKFKKAGVSECVALADSNSGIAKALNSSKYARLSKSEYMLRTRNSAAKSDIVTGVEIVLGLADTYDTDSEMKDAVRVSDRENKEFKAFVMPFKDGVYVYDVEVAEGKRDQGLGTRYMQALMKAYADSFIYIQVGSDNPRALHVYKKLGFEIIEEIGYYNI